MAPKKFLSDRINKAVARYLIPVVALQTRLAFAEHENDAGMPEAFYHFMSCMGKEKERKI